jgi:hypothetical protein
MRPNLAELFKEGADPDLFGGTLLHELAHYFERKTWWRGDYENTKEALAAAAAGRAASLFHDNDPFLAEYYQYGRTLTYK